jgi:hypothetical protein
VKPDRDRKAGHLHNAAQLVSLLVQETVSSLTEPEDRRDLIEVLRKMADRLEDSDHTNP